MFAASAVPATYQATASILLLPPTDSTATNPYLGLGGLTGATDVLARNLSDSATVNKLNARGLAGSYTVVTDQTTSAPILLVTAKSKSPSASLAMLRAVDKLVGPTLAQLQQNISVPLKDRISTSSIYADTTPSAIRKSQTRAVLAATAVGLFLAVLLAALAERLFGRRRLSAEPPVRRGSAAPENERRSRHASDLDRSTEITAILPARRLISRRAGRRLGGGPDVSDPHRVTDVQSSGLDQQQNRATADQHKAASSDSTPMLSEVDELGAALHGHELAEHARGSARSHG
jgi:hypothetical protein